MMRLGQVIAAVLALCLGACATTSSSSQHGQLTELSRVEGPITLCDHQVPERVCTRHHPELVANFKKSHDWCEPHGVPESQCLKCHPDLTFDPLPRVLEGSDVAVLSKAGEDVAALEPFAVAGKVTVFEFSADWCAACRKVEGFLLNKFTAAQPTFAFRKLNIVSWESPLGQRYLGKVESLPLLVVFGRDGKKRELNGADLSAL